MNINDSDLLTEVDNRIKKGQLKISIEGRIYGTEWVQVIFLESDSKRIELTVV